MKLGELRALGERVGVVGPLSGGDVTKRVAALNALDCLHALDSLPRLTELVDDPSPAVREALAATMVRLTEPGPQYLAKQWLLRHSATGRAWFSRLCHLGGEVHPVELIVTSLRRLAADVSAVVRERATLALGQLSVSAASAEPELFALIHDADESVRCRAARALARVAAADARVNRSLAAMLHDRSVPVRIAAARAVGLRGEAASVLVPLLLELMGDADPTLREAASEAVDQISALTDTPHGDPTTRTTTAVRALPVEAAVTVHIERPEALPDLIQALEDADPQVRRNAAKAVGRAGASAAPVAPALVAALRDPEPDVAAAAATALGKIGPGAAGAAPALLEALHHPNTEVRAHAAEALSMLGPAGWAELAISLRR
jgi:HEAT repeat protein